MKKRLLALTLTLCTVLTMFPVQVLADEPGHSRNVGRQNYSGSIGGQGTPVTSYLYDNGSGLTRVEYTNGQVIIEEYSSGFQLRHAQIVAPELPIWGGFFSGTQYNFLIYGQENDAENDNTEVVRVVKYSKAWERLGQTSIRGVNTVLPFRSGSLRCTEYNGMLYIHTCHKMYASSDGKNHQANMTFSIRQSDMTLTDSQNSADAVKRVNLKELLAAGISRLTLPYAGYVSHSFNQFILIDQNGNIVTCDHGDAYPRAITIQRYWNKAGNDLFMGYTISRNICSISGTIGDNNTGASLGGLAETSSGYVVAYNRNSNDLTSTVRDVYLGYVPKDYKSDTSVKTICLTSPGINGTPILAPNGLEGGWILWEENVNGTITTCYAHYNAEGTVGTVQRINNVRLSDCQPVPYGNSVIWYTTGTNGNESAPIFYILNAAGVRSCVPTQESVPTVAGFNDVFQSDYYADAVAWAVGQGITTGTGTGYFSPDTPCTRAQAVTFLWRAAGQPEPESTENPFADVVDTNDAGWYYKAVLWAIESGITTGTTATTFSPDETCTRAQIVTFLYREKGVPTVFSENSFSDVCPDAYYSDAVQWAVDNGITTGTGNGTFSPNDNCTRGQIVTFLYRNAG